MLIRKLIITCGRHVSRFCQLESELPSHNLLISSDKWSSHQLGWHTVAEHSFLAPTAALLFSLLFSCFSIVTLHMCFFTLILLNYISKQTLKATIFISKNHLHSVIYFLQVCTYNIPKVSKDFLFQKNSNFK